MPPPHDQAPPINRPHGPSRRLGANLSLACLALAAVVWLVYWPGLDGGFAFDDLPNIVDNVQLHVRSTNWHDWLGAIFSSPASTLQRPLAMLTFAVNHYFTGLDPRPMKLTNIAIHVLNALLLFGLMRALVSAAFANCPLPRLPPTKRRQELAAAFVSFSWALHPINLMAVLFIVQRMESLSHTFVFAGLWLYVVGRLRQLSGRPGWPQIVIGLILGAALGLLAKESAVLLPLYAFCIELCLFRFRTSEGAKVDPRLTVMYVLLLGLPVIAALSWLLPVALAPGAFSGRDFTLGERLLTESRVVLDYLQWTLLPDLGQLSMYHDDYLVSRSLLDPPATLFAVIALATTLALAWLLRARRPLLSLGLFWFFAAQALTATIIPLELMFEHRNYFASAGICLALADILILAPRARFISLVAGVLAAFFLVFCAVSTFLRATEWNHPVRFASSEAAKHPLSPRATYELARTLVILSNYKPSSPYFQPALTAIEQARRVPHSNILPEQAALIVSSRNHLPLQADWWRGMQTKLQERPLTPQNLGAIQALAVCAETRKCAFPPSEMLATFGAALKHGDNPELLNIYADYVLNSLGDVPLSLRLWQESVRLRPDEPQYRINLAEMLIALGHDQEARVEIAALRRLGRLGQNERAAQTLEKLLDDAAKARKNGDASTDVRDHVRP